MTARSSVRMAWLALVALAACSDDGGDSGATEDGEPSQLADALEVGPRHREDVVGELTGGRVPDAPSGSVGPVGLEEATAFDAAPCVDDDLLLLLPVPSALNLYLYCTYRVRSAMGVWMGNSKSDLERAGSRVGWWPSDVLRVRI